MLYFNYVQKIIATNNFVIPVLHHQFVQIPESHRAILWDTGILPQGYFFATLRARTLQPVWQKT